MDHIKLSQLSKEDGKDIYEMLQRIGPSENAFNNEVNGMTYDQYKTWLSEREAWAHGDMLPDGYVKQWIFWLRVNGIPVGFGKLREKLTEESRRFGGNIGYAIDPVVRGNGYGNILFELLLEEAQKREIPEIYSTVEKYNYRSKKVHEKYGGKMINEDETRWYFYFR